MATRQARTFCRICAAHCGMVLTIEEGTERIVDAKGDKGNPLSQGYVSVALPGGVTGNGCFRQSLPALPDQEAVVPLSGTTATTSTLIFDDSNENACLCSLFVQTRKNVLGGT